MSEVCAVTRLVDEHFAGGISPADERRLRAHLPGCTSCQERYERQLLLGRIDPGVLGPRDRLAQGLGLSLRGGRAWSWALLAAAAAAGLLLLVPRPSEFRARGAATAESPPELRVFALKEGRATPAGDVITASDELAFAYRNPAGFTHLMVYAVDEHAHVYWFHPAWSDETQDPTAIPIAAGASMSELPEAVAHPFDGKRLQVTGLFARTPLTVRQVEAAVRDGAALPDTREVRVPLEVRR